MSNEVAEQTQNPPGEPRIRAAIADELDGDTLRILTASVEATGGASRMFWVLARHESLFRRYIPFAGRLLKGSLFLAGDRELIILQTALRCGCDYEVWHHLRIAKEAGVSAAQIAAVRGESLPSELSDRTNLIIAAVDQLLQEHCIDEKTFSLLKRHFSTQQLIELPFLVGNYAMLAGFLNTMDIRTENGT